MKNFRTRFVAQYLSPPADARIPASSPYSTTTPAESAGGRPSTTNRAIATCDAPWATNTTWAPATPTSRCGTSTCGDRSPDATPLPPNRRPLGPETDSSSNTWPTFGDSPSAWKAVAERQRQSDQRRRRARSGGVGLACSAWRARDIPSGPCLRRPCCPGSGGPRKTSSSAASRCPPSTISGCLAGCRGSQHPGSRQSHPQPAAAPSPGVVFFLHGNGGNLDSWFSNHDLYRQANLDLFHDRLPGLRARAAAAAAAKPSSWLTCGPPGRPWKLRYPGAPKVIHGRSLGSGPAAILAASQAPDRSRLLLQPQGTHQDLHPTCRDSSSRSPWTPVLPATAIQGPLSSSTAKLTPSSPGS